MRFRVAIAFTAGSFLLTGPAATEPNPDMDLGARIDRYVAPFLADGHLSGTLLVARGEDVVLERSWGMANYELDVPNRPTTRFCVASVSKSITIALLCKLAEDGRVSPEDPISKWIPEFPRGGETTVSHLLNHRARVPHRVTTWKDEAVPRTAEDMVQLVLQTPLLDHEPGAKSVYSSAGFSVLARVLELASGDSYGDLLRKHLCEPLGLENTGHTTAEALMERRASPYFVGAEGLMNGPLQDLSFLVGGGSVYSTPRDLHRLMRGVVDGTLGPVVSGALLREDGMNWNGVTNGFRAFASYERDTDVSIVFTGNLLTGATDLLRRDVPRLVRGEDVATPERVDIVPVDVSDETLQRWVGTYRNEEGKEFEGRIQGRRFLYGQWPMIPTSDSTFFSPQDYGRITVVSDADGEVERLDWSRIEGTWPWYRVRP